MIVLTWSIERPVLSDEVVDHAKAAAREQSLKFNADRTHTLVACALYVERFVGRVLWPGARAAISIVRISDPSTAISLLPGLLDMTGVSLGAAVVREWSDTLEDWQATTVTKRPAGLVLLPRPGEYELSVSVNAPTETAPEAVEAVARLWAWSDTLKPGDLTEIGGEQQVLAGGLMKSGAAECLRPIRVHTVV